MKVTSSCAPPSSAPVFRHALSLAEEAGRLEKEGRHAEADQMADRVRRICAQSVMRNVGEFAGYHLRGLANGVAAVGGAVGQGLQDFGGGVAGGWAGQYAPVGGSPGVKQPGRPDTAHLPSAEAHEWARTHGTTIDQFEERCRQWVSRNGRDGLLAHLKKNGVHSDLSTYINRRLPER